MKLTITILGLLLAISFAKCDENKAPSAEAAQAVVKSSVTQKAKDEKTKIDSETKDQLEETTNDDKELQKQQKEQDNKASSDTEGYAENDSQEADEGSAEDLGEDEGEKDSDDAAESDDSTIKRAEEGKDSKAKSDKKGKKMFGYPLFYPGDYFGGWHPSELGGPAGFHPGSIWEYPYPFVHPMYPSPYFPCSCKCKGKAFISIISYLFASQPSWLNQSFQTEKKNLEVTQGLHKTQLFQTFTKDRLRYFPVLR